MIKLIPNPGSKEAIKQKCICPINDNRKGAGYMGMTDVFVYNQGCPVHSKQPVVTPTSK